MKKVLLIIAVVCVSFTSVAQGVSFGVKGGANFANSMGDTRFNKSKIGFHIGVMVEKGLSDRFAIQPELLYSTQGYKNKINDSKMKLDYLNLPVIAKYYVAEGVSFEAGPQIGFLLSAKAEDIDVKEFRSLVDFGLNFGVGYKLDNKLNFGVRYNLGLSNVLDLDSDSYSDSYFRLPDPSVQNSVFQISIGYFF